MNVIANISLCVGLANLFEFSPSTSLPTKRHILDQSPTTIQQYFGTPLKRELDDKGNQYYTYPILPLTNIFPDLPEKATFSILFTNYRAREIRLTLNAIPDEGSGGSYPEPFYWRQTEAFMFYRYLFGYSPSLWEEIDLPNGGGGHEGFINHKFCLGDGIATTFMTYIQGQEDIRLFYTPLCDNPSHENE